MIFDNTQQEVEHAKSLIALQIENSNNYIDEHLLKMKEEKKRLRRLTKQQACEHDFKLKQNGLVDHYKCKKCKFEFE